MPALESSLGLGAVPEGALYLVACVHLPSSRLLELGMLGLGLGVLGPGLWVLGPECSWNHACIPLVISQAVHPEGSSALQRHFCPKASLLVITKKSD